MRLWRTKPTVVVDSGGRGGDVTYTDANGTLRFCWEAAEFGYEISVPTRDVWEAETGLPLAMRAPTLALLGEAFVAKRGGPGATYTIVEGAVQIRP